MCIFWSNVLIFLLVLGEFKLKIKVLKVNENNENGERTKQDGILLRMSAWFD